MSVEDSIHEQLTLLKEDLVKIEKAALERIAQTEEEKNIKPYRTTLQLDHPCCECGIVIPREHYTVIAHAPLHVGHFLTSQLIAWCDPCWKRDYGQSGEDIMKVPPHKGTSR